MELVYLRIALRPSPTSIGGPPLPIFSGPASLGCVASCPVKLLILPVDLQSPRLLSGGVNVPEALVFVRE